MYFKEYHFHSMFQIANKQNTWILVMNEKETDVICIAVYVLIYA